MNIKIIVNLSLLIIILAVMPGCALTPKSIPDTTLQSNCILSTSEWTLDVTPIDVSGVHCHSEECAMLIVSVPLVSAAISIPIILIGNSIHAIEEQLRCN